MNTKTIIITRLTVALTATVLSAGVTACSADAPAAPTQQIVPSDTPSEDAVTRQCSLLSGWERSYCG